MALGGGWLLAGVIAGGAVVGVGVGVATGGADSIEVLASVSTFDCPAGATVGALHSGDRVFATGRDDSGAWLEVRAPRDQRARVWVEARYVTPDNDTAGLDVRSCDEQGEVAFAPAAGDTTATTTPGAPAPGGGTPARGTPAPGTPAPGGGSTGGGSTGGGSPAAPDTAGPTITSASVTPGEIWEQDGGGILCGAKPRQATVAASANDPSGVASISASWAFGTVNQTKNVPATFGPFPYLTVPDNTTSTITITITARDTAGNASSTTRQVVLNSTAKCFV